MSKRPKRAPASTSYGLLFNPSLRRMVRSAGYKIRPDVFGHPDSIAVWGRVKRSRKLIEMHKNAKVLTFEDAFLRSATPGPKTPPIGFTIDDLGVHFECKSPSRLETICQTSEFDDADLMRAKNGREFLCHYGLSKYNLVPRGHGNLPRAGYVLVIDQLVGDASISGANADASTFETMLDTAIKDNPGQQIVIRKHPAAIGNKGGYFDKVEASDRITVLSSACNPWDILERADKVYCVSSHMGFEAIMAGHRPNVFGIPFYAGWGLSEDMQPCSRRTRTLSIDQLFTAAMITFPFWFDHITRTECSFEHAARQLLASSKHHWDGMRLSRILGMSYWKHPTIRKFLSGAGHRIRFYQDEAKVFADLKSNDQVVVWAGKHSEQLRERCGGSGTTLVSMEDGFLRSTGLGAELTPALSLVLDDIGIYYDPSAPSRLERLISRSLDLNDFALTRAAALRAELMHSGVTKYNLAQGGAVPDVGGERWIILVAGQVEDDKSIQKGAGDIRTNTALLRAARAANPDAYIIYKPHPDVLAGLRDGEIASTEHCDFFADNHDTIGLLDHCDEIWTMTSLLGFEALIRGKKVTCTGMPFYAGWGLTNDVGLQCPRRNSGVTLDGLVHAALIDYPRYIDPFTGRACTPERIVHCLAHEKISRKPLLRILAKLQNRFSSYVRFWR